MSFPQLPAYRISGPLSAKLRLVTLLAVTAVLWVHANNMSSRFVVGENAAEASGAPGVVGFVEYLVSQALTRWPAAVLFAISGFLFFHNLQPLWSAYRRKYARRVRTVVVPFLLWSGISLAVYLVLQAVPQSAAYFSSDFFSGLSLGHIADKLLLHPVAYPLWFLQTLIVCFALAPLLYWPARALRWLAPLPFAALWILGAPAANWNDWKGLAFFTLGAVIALERRRGVRLTPAPWVGRWLFPLWVLACVVFTAYLRGESAFWAYSLHKALMCMAVAAVWFGYETYLRPLEGRRLVTFLLPFSFFIFVAQEPLLTTLKRLGLRELGSSDAAMLFVYFAAPLLTLVAVVAVAAALRRYLPTPYAWLTGGRGGRSARRSHGRGRAEDPAPAVAGLEGEPALAETGGAPKPVRRGS
ncbi:MAG TPA: acyltransferase [Thermoleophilia bacterium]|nr:acyltransferase [Thermoleophilia bacterium]